MNWMLREKILENLLSTERDRPEPPKSEDACRARSCDHWSRPVLLERAAYLRELARFGDGSAGEAISESPGYCTMLAVRLRSGPAEIHEMFGGIFIVLAGNATLVTGGTIEKREQAGWGEIRGSAIAGGSNQKLVAGDIVHVAAGMPHQILLSGNDTLSYLLVKITKGEEP